ncbi:MAG TPA: GAF domain-containing protein [Baekduia sp.]|uniref:sensor histidine kinase n=1 Tax=Baekduia sp. TaxID=2600305 RepID=UPI002D77B8CE|nr:GAF domain-containing protein [Baekduia sp.]HET6506079.1 GAF domain-containing protein [Baekduia sp.]
MSQRDGVQGVLELARSVLEDLDVEVVLERVLVAARELTGARYAAIGILDEERTGLARFVTLGLEPGGRAKIGAPPRGHGVLGELITHPVPLRLTEVADHPRSYGFPHGHPEMHSFLGVPVLAAGEPYGNLYLTDKAEGAPFTADDEAALTRLADFAGVAIDHARRFTGSEHERLQLSRTVAALDATVQIALALGGQTDLDKILQLVAKRGRALVSARALAIELLDGDELVVAATAGEVPAALLGRRVPVVDTVADAALRSQTTQRLEDEPNRERLKHRGIGRLGFKAGAGLAVPLVFRGHAYGVLLVADRLDDGPQFGEDDQRLLESFAASAATAVATAQNVALEQRRMRLAATEEERRRWARELHDETLQSLAALRLGLSAARRAKDDPAALDGLLGDAVSQLDGEIATLRALITELRPPALDELGLAAAVAALAERSGQLGLEVDVDVDLGSDDGDDGAGRDPEGEIVVYRIIQEALNNARKHGAARRAVATVARDGRSVVVTVRDDGCGFDPATAPSGFGLVGMRERAELLGGSLAVQSRVGEGTTIVATLPFRADGASPVAGMRDSTTR